MKKKSLFQIITTLPFFLFTVIIISACTNKPKFVKSERITELTDGFILDEDGNETDSFKVIILEWELGYYLYKGDTLFAALDTEGNQITPFCINRPRYVGEVDGIFICTLWNDTICDGDYSAYTIYGKPITQQFHDYDDFGDGFFKFKKISDKNYNVVYNSNGRCIVPDSLKADKIYRRGNIFIVEKKLIDENKIHYEEGEELYTVYNQYGHCIIPFSEKMWDYHYDSDNDILIAICTDENNDRIMSAWDEDGECIISAANKYNHIKIMTHWGGNILWGKYLVDSRGEDEPDNRIVTYTYSNDGKYYVEGAMTSDGTISPYYYEHDGYEFDERKQRASTDGANTHRPTIESRTSSSSSSQSELGLLFKGPYTVDLGSGPIYEFISVYEDYLYDGSTRYDYKGLSNGGARIYSGSGFFGSYNRWYVYTTNQNIQLETTYTSQWGSSTKTGSVTKGHDFNQRVTFGGNPSGGYTSQPTPSNNNPGRDNPSSRYVERTYTCTYCQGKGTVPECDGGIPDFNGGSKYCSECGKTVPMCHIHKRCPSCHGKGTYTKMER